MKVLRFTKGLPLFPQMYGSLHLVLLSYLRLDEPSGKIKFEFLENPGSTST